MIKGKKKKTSIMVDWTKTSPMMDLELRVWRICNAHRKNYAYKMIDDNNKETNLTNWLLHRK